MKKVIVLILSVVIICGCEHIPQTYYIPDSLKPLFNDGDTFFLNHHKKKRFVIHLL